MTLHYNFSYTDNMILNEPLVEYMYIDMLTSFSRTPEL